MNEKTLKHPQVIFSRYHDGKNRYLQFVSARVLFFDHSCSRGGGTELITDYSHSRGSGTERP